MNPSPDDPHEGEAPLTRAGFGLEAEDSMENTVLDPSRTLNADDPVQTLEVTDPAMTRGPSPDLTAGSLADWVQSSMSPRTDFEPAGPARRGIVGKIEPGQTLYSKYQVLKKLGGGAMGDVWLVRHSTLKSEHALKVIVPNFARNAVALMRFQREFEVMATLRHEHAVTIYDACIDDEGGYIDMEFVDGLTLDTILAGAKTRPDRLPFEPLMPLDWIVRVLDQLCEVLQTAHDKGIVHRDLKPSNMMLLNGRKPGKEYLKVLDFGIAKIRDDPDGASGREQEESSNKTEGFIGTPSYGSPEQALAMEDVDGRADLYSVGIMLYEFITGRLPFRGSPLQVMSQNANAPPPPFYEANPGLRSMPEVEYAVFRVLSKDRKQRPQTARELFEEFRDAVAAVLPTTSPDLTPPTWESIPFYSPGPAGTTTEFETAGGAQGLLSTIEATLVGPSARTEPVKQPALQSATDLGPVRPDRPGPPWKVILGVVGLVAGLLIVAGLIASFRSKGTIIAGPTTPTANQPRFEDYWPETFVAVDASAKNQIWPDKVRQTVLDREFYRFADGIYLPDRYEPEDKNQLVGGWPAAILRDGIRFIRIEGDLTWQMGDSDSDLETGASDVPAHSVKLSGYYLQETEVTNGQYEAYLEQKQMTTPQDWERVYGDLKRKVDRDVARKHPAVNLSRKQALTFARSLDAQLPTEAQWEFAARSRGKKRRYVWGNSPNPSYTMANVDPQSQITTVPVKSFPQDKTLEGVYDMLGNVQEFCRDSWKRYKRNVAPDLDPCEVPDNSSPADYVIRGASFDSTPDNCALTRREEHRPETDFAENIGFRLVVECPVLLKKP